MKIKELCKKVENANEIATMIKGGSIYRIYMIIDNDIFSFNTYSQYNKYMKENYFKDFTKLLNEEEIKLNEEIIIDNLKIKIMVDFY